MDTKLVVHFFWSLHNGGVETLMRSLARSRPSYLFCFDTSVVDGEDFKGIYKISSVKGIFTLIIIALKLPIWHFHDYNLYKWFKFLPGQKILQLHNIETPGILSITSRTKVTVVSETVKYYYKGRIKNSKEELVVIEPSIDVPNLPVRYQEQNRFVVIGRLHHIKGQLTLLHAMSKSRKFFGVQVDIIGDGDDYEAIRAFIAEAGLVNVRLLGSLQRIRIIELLPCYKGVIVPSEFETFGLIVLEAIACKVPVLIRNVDHLKQFESRITYPCIWSTVEELYRLINNVGNIESRQLNATYQNFRESLSTSSYISTINKFYEAE